MATPSQPDASGVWSTQASVAVPMVLLLRMNAAAQAAGIPLSSWIEEAVAPALREHEQPAADPTQGPRTSRVWHGLAPPTPGETAYGSGGSPFPTSPGDKELENRIQAVIYTLGAQSEACTQTPPDPDGAGWGVPPWENPAASFAEGELDPLEAEWEFLRRNPGYRRDWLRPDAEFAPCTRQRYFQDVYDVHLPQDPRLGVRDMPVRGRRSKDGKTDASSVSWPSERTPLLDGLLSRRVADFEKLELIVRRPPSPVDLYVRFSLMRPIGTQWAEVKELIERYRDEFFGEPLDQARRQQDLWPLYLRMLDAKDAGTSHQERASILPATMTHSPQRASAVLKAAEELRRRWRH